MQLTDSISGTETPGAGLASRFFLDRGSDLTDTPLNCTHSLAWQERRWPFQAGVQSRFSTGEERLIRTRLDATRLPSEHCGVIPGVFQ
jgi:hypothetical protein